MLTYVQLSATMQAVGVDCLANRHNRKGPVATFDLTNRTDQMMLESLLEGGEIDVIHGAPPCGTATRARDRPLHKAQGIKPAVWGPQRARSDQYPEGLPGLTGTLAARVSAANVIYEWLASFIRRADWLGCLWSVENPAGSYLWATRWWKNLYTSRCRTIFQSCMHGGTRDSWRCWLGNFDELLKLNIVCDKQHVHAPWGTKADGSFHTADEAAYPMLLCVRVVEQQVLALLARGVVGPATSHADAWLVQLKRHDAMAVSTMQQPSG